MTLRPQTDGATLTSAQSPSRSRSVAKFRAVFALRVAPFRLSMAPIISASPVDRQRVGDVTTLYRHVTAVLAYALAAERADALQQWHPERKITALGIHRGARRIGLNQHKIAGL